ncbi:DUF512 domain-containing protein [Eggerthellaceae bacterium 3-80]
MIYPTYDMEKCGDCSCGQPAALIRFVEPLSPADDAGFSPGCKLTSVDGHPLRDLIDWRWLSDGDIIEVGYVDLDGEAGSVELERDAGQDWGFEFDGVIFDEIKQCRNACTFCFMRQLPDHLRPSLTLRDDDFRLSFLSGTFVTFTNLKEADEARIVEQALSPLRVSLHAYDAHVRRRIIGKHAEHGLEALKRLLAAGIHFHAQIVLMPDENDGEVLQETLAWAYGQQGVEDVCIVPLGYTKHQHQFSKSFNDPATSREVLKLIEPFQKRALVERQTPWVFAADEFYSNAYQDDLLNNLPDAQFYGDFAMFEDGVGIIRTFVDDWHEAQNLGLVDQLAEVCREHNRRVYMVLGDATKHFFSALLENSNLAGWLCPLYVDNTFFGGNVDVTGLLCGCDVACAIKSQATLDPDAYFALLRVMFNDSGVTLDDMNVQQIKTATGCALGVVSCQPTEFLPELIADLSLSGSGL